MKSFYILSILTLLSCSLFAQVKISGKVSNINRIPIGYATVTLLDTLLNQKLSSQTDSLGHYVFNARPGQYRLTVTSTGFKAAVFNFYLHRDTAINVTMGIANIHLRGVTITADKPVIENNTEKLTYNVAGSITASGTDALTAISKIPGIKANDNEIGIVGKGNVRVMVNNRVVQLAGIDLARYLKSISANQISKIELIKNPGAAYDAEGNAGLINITLKRSKREGLTGTAQVNGRHWFHNPATVFGTSDYGAVNASTDLNYNSGRWSAFGTVNFDVDHELEGFETDVFYPTQTWKQTDTGNYRHHNINFNIGADYRISPKATVGFLYQGGRDLYDGSDHVNNPVYNKAGGIDSTLRTYATYFPIARTNAINFNAAINFDTTGRKLVLNADYFNYFRTDHSDFESNTFLSDGSINPASNTRYFDTNKQNINIYTFKADAALPTKFVRFAFGAKISFINTYSNAFYYDKTGLNTQTYNTSLSNEFDYRENTQSGYVSMDKEQGKWKYVAGIRAEYTQTTGYSFTLNQKTPNKYFKLFPSLSVTYQQDKDNSFGFTFGRRINRPTFWNLNPFKSLFTAYSYGEGNPFLQPEYNTNVEVSHTYKSMLTSAVFLNITNNGFSNITIARPDTNFVLTTALNFIKTYRVGVSESLSLQLFSWLDNNEQVTFYHTDAHSTISAISSIQGYGLYLAASNNIFFNKDKTFAGAVNFWYQFPEVDHIGRSDPYYKLDLGLKASTFNKKLDVTLTMNDLFRSSATAVTSTVNGVREKFTNFQLNRYLLLSLNYKFGSSTTKEAKETGNQEERKRF